MKVDTLHINFTQGTLSPPGGRGDGGGVRGSLSPRIVWPKNDDCHQHIIWHVERGPVALCLVACDDQPTNATSEPEREKPDDMNGTVSVQGWYRDGTRVLRAWCSDGAAINSAVMAQ